MRTCVYIDASNLSYGGRKSLGWSIDYRKFFAYLQDKYGAEKVYYFGGIEIHHFPFDYIKSETVPLVELEKYLTDLIYLKGKYMTDAKIVLLDKHLNRVRFYKKLEQFGYTVLLKPVKTYKEEDGSRHRKANCDVDISFSLMRDASVYDRLILVSGDGDFLPVLKYLRSEGKRVLLLSRSERTAREIKRFAGSAFRDFHYLEKHIKQESV